MTWSTFSAAVSAVAATAAVIVYLMPFIVATLRRVPARYWIMLVNLAFGFTVVGWIAALIWAFKAAPEEGGRPRPVWPVVAMAGFTLLYLPAALFLMADPAREAVNLYWPLFPLFQFMLMLGSIANSVGRTLACRVKLVALCTVSCIAGGLIGGAVVEFGHSLLAPTLPSDSSWLTAALVALSLVPAISAHRRFWRSCLRTGIASLGAAVVLLLAASGSAGAATDKPPPCRHLPSTTLSGTIRQLGVVQIEPAETPHFYFRLDLEKPWCGLRSIDFSLPRPSFCLDGDLAAVTGELWPPSPPFEIPLFDVRGGIACARHEAP